MLIKEIDLEVELACNKVAVKRLAELRNGKVNGVSAAEEFYLHLGFAEVAKVMEMKIKKRR